MSHFVIFCFYSYKNYEFFLRRYAGTACGFDSFFYYLIHKRAGLRLPLFLSCFLKMISVQSQIFFYFFDIPFIEITFPDFHKQRNFSGVFAETAVGFYQHAQVFCGNVE